MGNANTANKAYTVPRKDLITNVTTQEIQQNIQNIFKVEELQKMLGLSSILALANTCKAFFAWLAPFIEQAYYFHCYPEGLCAYEPNKLIIYDNSPKWDYLKNVTHIRLSDACQKPLQDKLPPTLTHLTLNEQFCQKLNITPSVTHITFGRDYYYPIETTSSLKSLTILGTTKNSIQLIPPDIPFPNNIYSFSLNCATPVPSPTFLAYSSTPKPIPLSTLPDTIEVLVLNNFNEQLNSNNLPKSIRVLSLAVFNQSVDNLPHSLRVLHLPGTFNQPLNHLPRRLESLILGSESQFDQPRITNLPDTLTTIALPEKWKGSIDWPPNIHRVTMAPELLTSSPLPPSVTWLKLYTDEDVTVPLSIPPSILQLVIFRFTPVLLNPLPPLCKMDIYSISQDLDKLPQQQVRILNFMRFVDDISSVRNFSSLTVLLLLGVEHPVTELPPSLEHLSIARYNHPLPTLPDSLKVLSLRDAFDQKVDKLPRGLRILALGKSFSRPLNSLPPSLRVLRVENVHYNHKLDKLPLSIVDLGINMYQYILESLHPSLLLVVNPIRTAGHIPIPGNHAFLWSREIHEPY